MRAIKNGQASNVVRVKLLDSSSTTGAGLTGLTSASSGLIISTIADNEAAAVAYTVAGSNVEGITTLGTFAAPTSGKCRFKEVDATNHKGLYELQFADARFAVGGAKALLISLAGAANLAQADFEIPLVADDPNVAKPANSALLSIDGSGRVDIGKVLGTAQTARDLGADTVAINNKTTNLPSDPADASDIVALFTALNTLLSSTGVALTAAERTAVANAHLDLANAIETGLTVRQAHRLEAAGAAGKLSGAATATVVVRNAVADSKPRITATVDADGNRSAVTTDVT